MEHEPGWLGRQMESIWHDVATWPQWMRDAAGFTEGQEPVAVKRPGDYDIALAGIRTQLTTARNNVKLLTTLLWLRHGCPSSALYGDDGEMQCHACHIDFKRATPSEIESLFMAITFARMSAAAQVKTT